MAANGPIDALLTLAAVIVVQQIEGNVIIPLVMAQRTKLHPALIAIGVVLVGQLFGFVGLFVAVPIISAFVILVDELPDETDLGLVIFSGTVQTVAPTADHDAVRDALLESGGELFHRDQWQAVGEVVADEPFDGLDATRRICATAPSRQGGHPHLKLFGLTRARVLDSLGDQVLER